MKRNNKVINSLKERFVEGEKLLVKEIVEEYYDPKTPYNYLVCQNKVRGQLNSVKRFFRNEKLWFGNIDGLGHYGLVLTKDEAFYSMSRYYKFVRGVMNRATLLAYDARKKGLLPKGATRERFLLTRVAKPEKKNKKEVVKRQGGSKE